MSEPTQSNDGLPAGMELGTVYLFPFRGGSGTLYEFVSAVSYHELERTLAAQHTALLALFDEAERTGSQGVAVRGREILGPER